MYDELFQALQLSGIPIAEGDWNAAPKDTSYMTIKLDAEAAALWGDDRQTAQAVMGSLHLFCRSKDPREMQLIQHILRQYEISWRLASEQDETLSRIRHYEWVFELEAM